ncbi:MAG: spermidine/putrescine ABC transporter substrate-binding protein [Ruminococcaceae bacterium]|nr:spermidine/putrescine ABC transporter substrate-binding protein [Oscillospiraceae bacterium]
MKKIVLFIAFIVILSVIFSGCGDDRTTLNIYNWEDYIDESILDEFEQEYPHIKINYERFITNEDMYNKITKSNSKYDLLFPSDYMIEKMIQEGLLAKIDFNNIPNYQLIDEKFKNLDFDPNNEYSVPYMWGTLGILYNKKIVDEKEITWDVLFGDKYKGQILMMDSVRDALGASLKSLGYSLNSTNAKEINEAKEKLIAHKKIVLAYGFDDIKDKMVAEEAAVALVYAGDALNAMNQNPNLAYAVPKEGSNLFFDSMVIPANSQHKTEAELFINFLCRTDIAKRNADFIEYYSVQSEAMKQIEAENQNPAFMYPGENKPDNWEIFKSLDENALGLYNKAWTEVTTTTD